MESHLLLSTWSCCCGLLLRNERNCWSPMLEVEFLPWLVSRCRNWTTMSSDWGSFSSFSLYTRLILESGMNSRTSLMDFRTCSSVWGWSLAGLATNSIFSPFLFVKTHWFAWRANQWPLIGETLFSSFPPIPATPSSPSRTLEGLFELTRCPSRALDSPRALLPELQRYKSTVRCGALGAEVPGHRQQQLTQTLIVRL